MLAGSPSRAVTLFTLEPKDTLWIRHGEDPNIAGEQYLVCPLMPGSATRCHSQGMGLVLLYAIGTATSRIVKLRAILNTVTILLISRMTLLTMVCSCAPSTAGCRYNWGGQRSALWSCDDVATAPNQGWR